MYGRGAGAWALLLVGAILGVVIGGGAAVARQSAAPSAPPGAEAAGTEPGARVLNEAQRLFYMGRFAEAAERALARITTEPTDLAAYEVRTSALHFQIRRAMGNGKDRKAALRACASCPALLSVFFDEIKRGTAAARARLAEAPDDEEAMYYLAKIDLSYLWLQLSTIGRRTGWDQYWEAKRLIAAVLEKEPTHLRALVARAWMDYIVGTRVPWGTRWVMGGGDRDRALRTLRGDPPPGADFYAKVEADFALWEMLAREGQRAEALPVAQSLLAKFPENEELARFVSGADGRPRPGSDR
jgi:hypothetical protein